MLMALAVIVQSHYLEKVVPENQHVEDIVVAGEVSKWNDADIPNDVSQAQEVTPVKSLGSNEQEIRETVAASVSRSNIPSRPPASRTPSRTVTPSQSPNGAIGVGDESFSATPSPQDLSSATPTRTLTKTRTPTRTASKSLGTQSPSPTLTPIQSFSSTQSPVLEGGQGVEEESQTPSPTRFFSASVTRTQTRTRTPTRTPSKSLGTQSPSPTLTLVA